MTQGLPVAEGVLILDEEYNFLVFPISCEGTRSIIFDTSA